MPMKGPGYKDVIIPYFRYALKKQVKPGIPSMKPDLSDLNLLLFENTFFFKTTQYYLRQAAVIFGAGSVGFYKNGFAARLLNFFHRFPAVFFVNIAYGYFSAF